MIPFKKRFMQTVNCRHFTWWMERESTKKQNDFSIRKARSCICPVSQIWKYPIFLEHSALQYIRTDTASANDMKNLYKTRWIEERHRQNKRGSSTRPTVDILSNSSSERKKKKRKKMPSWWRRGEKTIEAMSGLRRSGKAWENNLKWKGKNCLRLDGTIVAVSATNGRLPEGNRILRPAEERAEGE